MMQIDGDVVILIDQKTGLSITNAAEDVVREVAQSMGPGARYRIIYRDTYDDYDGLAQRDGRFVTYVPLRTKDRFKAIALARAGIDTAGRDWPA